MLIIINLDNLLQLFYPHELFSENHIMTAVSKCLILNEYCKLNISCSISTNLL